MNSRTGQLAKHFISARRTPTMIEITITFLALLALIALVGGGSALIVLGRSPLTAVSVLYPYTNGLAVSVATVATLGSLFMSEIAGFTPCLLCWVQRAFMYPLMLVFLMRRHFRVQSLWIVAWALAGALVSAFHYAEERIPALIESSFCSPKVPCSFIWFERFGFVTLPLMAFSAFVAVASLMLVEHRGQKARVDLTDARLS